MIKGNIGLILALIISINALGQQDSAVHTKEIQVVDTNFNEAKAYKMLYENQLKSNDAILKTIYYALGGLGTAILLVFGSNWWFNDKKVKDIISEVDNKVDNVKRSITSELTEKIISVSSEKAVEANHAQNKLQEKVSNSLDEINSRFNEFSDRIRGMIKEDMKSAEVNYQNLLKSYSDNTSQLIGSVRESVDTKTKDLQDKIDKTNGYFKDTINTESNKLKRDILKHNARINFLNNQYNNALKSYLDFALLDYQIGYKWSLEYSSKDIILCLEKVAVIYSDEAEALDTLIKTAEKDYPEIVSKITTLYKAKPTKAI